MQRVTFKCDVEGYFCARTKVAAVQDVPDVPDVPIALYR